MDDLSTRVDRLAAELCNWDRWGPDDELGTLNLITADKRTEAASAVREGDVFSLAFELRADCPQPAGSGRLNPQHLITETVADTKDAKAITAGSDDMLIMAVHAATHWDALSHIFHHNLMYGGRPASLVTPASGAARNDIVPVSRKLVTRGVLADVPRRLGLEHLPSDHAITADELQDTLDAQGVDLRSGDALLVRTGRLGATKASGGWADYTETGAKMPTQPGVAFEALTFLREQGVSALACDNWAVEYRDGRSGRFPLHELSLVYMGMILGETFELDALAAACAADGRYDFLLAAPPLPIAGGVGGPVNPVAIR